MRVILFCMGLLMPELIQAQANSLLPVPAEISAGSQRFQLDSTFHVVMHDEQAGRATDGVLRMLRRLDDRTRLLIPKNIDRAVNHRPGPEMVVEYSRQGKLEPFEDESYTLTVSGDRVHLTAITDLGVLHGLETFLQLVSEDSKGFFLPGVTIRDQPRFTWRGLLIDVGRHFSPVEVIKRQLDAMAMVKLNVLHLHLSDDQGFRIESRKFPRLHELGSSGNYFTQEQIREIIAFADARGIRVVPEFDMPGHTTSWFVGYPELASAPGPYAIEKGFGIFDPAMNPASKRTYRFLAAFIGEMSRLFPDPYFHIGGDENNGVQWNKNHDIRKFMTKHGLENNHQLQAWFNRKLLKILLKNHKIMVGWDEIMEPSIPGEAVIQSWRGKEGLKDAAKAGYRVILSNGYYVDLCQPAWKHYLNDPLPGDAGLTEAEQQKVLGGEATMWSELVTPDNIESRIWPRTAAIAERLWSPASVRDISDMYRRLEIMTARFEGSGIRCKSYQEMMLRRMVPGTDIAPLLFLASWIEPMKEYNRHRQGVRYSTDLPLTRMPDIAAPESDRARNFYILTEDLVKGKDTSVVALLKRDLESLRENHTRLMEEAANIKSLQAWILRSTQLDSLAAAGLQALQMITQKTSPLDPWVHNTNALIANAGIPVEESELAILPAIKMLFQYALPK